MAQQKLTKLGVEQIPAQGKDVVVWDTALPSFGIRVKPTGIRSYIIQYRDRTTGASKRMTIGQHGALLTFDQAKKQAPGRKAPNMADLASDYLERHAVPKKRPKSVRDDRAMLENVILPAVGTKKGASIRKCSIWPSSVVGGETTPPRGSSGIGRKSVTDGSRTKSFRA